MSLLPRTAEYLVLEILMYNDNINNIRMTLQQQWISITRAKIHLSQNRNSNSSQYVIAAHHTQKLTTYHQRSGTICHCTALDLLLQPKFQWACQEYNELD